MVVYLHVSNDAQKIGYALIGAHSAPQSRSAITRSAVTRTSHASAHGVVMRRLLTRVMGLRTEPTCCMHSPTRYHAA